VIATVLAVTQSSLYRPSQPWTDGAPLLYRVVIIIHDGQGDYHHPKTVRRDSPGARQGQLSNTTFRRQQNLYMYRSPSSTFFITFKSFFNATVILNKESLGNGTEKMCRQNDRSWQPRFTRIYPQQADSEAPHRNRVITGKTINRYFDQGCMDLLSN